MAMIYGNRWLVKKSMNEGPRALSLSSRIAITLRCKKWSGCRWFQPMTDKGYRGYSFTCTFVSSSITHCRSSIRTISGSRQSDAGGLSPKGAFIARAYVGRWPAPSVATTRPARKLI
jgi:hypothetical protein